MRNRTSRALRVTATVAGVAALGAMLTANAAADVTDYGSLLGGTHDGSFDSSPSGLGDFGSPGLEQPGLHDVKMPSLQSKSVHTSSLDKSIRADSDDSDDDSDEDANDAFNDEFCGESRDEEDENGNGIQRPVQCEGNSFGNNFGTGDELSLDDLDGLGHFGTSGPTGVRSESPLDDTEGVDDLGGSSSDDDASTEDLDNGSTEDLDEGGSPRGEASSLTDVTGGDGLSGHKITLPVG